MIGILLTLLAMLLVFCVAFYSADSPGERFHGADPVFLRNPAGGKGRRAPK